MSRPRRYQDTLGWALGMRKHCAIWDVPEEGSAGDTFGMYPNRCKLLMQSPLEGPVHVPIDVMIYRVRRHAELSEGMPNIRASLAPKAKVWIAWPREAPTDIDAEAAEAVAAAHGLARWKALDLNERWTGVGFKVRPI